MEDKPKLCCSGRLVMTLCCFVATFNLTYMRVGVSFVMVCMVRGVTKNETEDPDCPRLEETQDSNLYEFEWPSKLQGHLVSAVFYGFLAGPFISGFLCFRYGGKIVLVIGSMLSGLSHLAIPELTRIHPELFFLIRIITGFFAGFTLPAVFDILTHWVIPEERQLLVGGALSGIHLGSILNFPINGFICEYLGWVWTFYFSAVWMMFWGIIFLALIHDYPSQCTYITQNEQLFVTQRTPQRCNNARIPWREILKSGPIYTYIVTHFCAVYGFLSILLSLPLFMKDVHRFELQSNSVLSGTPFIGPFVLRLLLSFYFDKLKSKLNMSTTGLRRVFTVIGLSVPSAALLAVTMLPCRHRYWALACFILGTTFMELALTGGYLMSLLDLCPSYANVLTGVSNAFANLAGLVSATLTGLITIHGTHEEWNLVHYITIGFLLTAMTVYAIFGTSELQHWGKAENEPLVQPLHRESFP